MKEIKLTPNNRYLFNYVSDVGTICEGTLIEISPSGKYYKFNAPQGTKFWVTSITINFLENLGPDPRGIPNPEYETANGIFLKELNNGQPINVGPPPSQTSIEETQRYRDYVVGSSHG